MNAEPADTDVPPYYERDVELLERSFTLVTTVSGLGIRTVSKSVTGDMNHMKGWYLDLKTPPSDLQEGERITSKPTYLGNVLQFASNSPSNDPCAPSMNGWLNFIDPFTGASLLGAYVDINGDGKVDNTDTVTGPDGNPTPAGSVNLGTGYTAGGTILPGAVTPGGPKPVALNTLPSKYLGRISWRELVDNND